MAAFASSAAATDTDASVTIAKPSGLAEGDLMVAFLSSSGLSGGWATLSGWTSMGSYSGDFDHQVSVQAKIAAAGDVAASDFTFTHSSGSGHVEGIMYRVTGTFASTANITAIAGQAGADQGSEIWRHATGITVNTANSLLIMFIHAVCSDSDTNDFTAYAIENSNPSWTETHDIQDPGATNDERVGSAYATFASTGSTGYYQADLNSGTVGRTLGVLLAITDTANGSASPAVVIATANIIAPTPSGSAPVTIGAAVDMTASVQTPTAAASAPEWVNTDKSSTSTFSNTTKS